MNVTSVKVRNLILKYDSLIKNLILEYDSLIEKGESEVDSLINKRIKIEESIETISGANYFLFGHIECEYKEIIFTESGMGIIITRVESVECRIGFEINSGDINSNTSYFYLSTKSYSNISKQMVTKE